MLRNLLSNISKEWRYLNTSAILSKNGKCSPTTIPRNANLHLINRILALEENNIQRSVGKTTPVKIDNNKGDKKISNFKRFFEGCRKKDKAYNFDKSFKDDICLWLSSVLAISSILIGHKWVHRRKTDNQCPLQHFDHEIVQYLLTNRSLNNALTLNVKPTSNSSASSSDKESNNKNIDEVIERFQETAYECNGSLLSQLGIKYFQLNQLGKAFKHFKEAASFQHTKSIYNMAICFEHGYGVEKCKHKAIESYKDAAEKGHVKSMYNLATLYYEDSLDDITSGFIYMKMAADNGLDKAQLFVALRYAEQKNFPDSFKYFKMAAVRNNVIAVYNLGQCYENGLGVRKNNAEAMKCYRKAAELKHPDSLLILAHSYQNGTRGLQRNLEKSMKYFQLAKQHGHRDVNSCIELVRYEMMQRNEQLFLNILNEKKENERMYQPINKIFNNSFHKSSSLPILKLQSIQQNKPTDPIFNHGIYI